MISFHFQDAHKMSDEQIRKIYKKILCSLYVFCELTAVNK